MVTNSRVPNAPGTRNKHTTLWRSQGKLLSIVNSLLDLKNSNHSLATQMPMETTTLSLATYIVMTLLPTMHMLTLGMKTIFPVILNHLLRW